MHVTMLDYHSTLLHDIYINQKRYGSYSDGLKRNVDIDRKYIEKVKETIKEDIGLDFQSFIDVLSYFSNLFSDEIVDKIGSNVFRGAYNELLNDFLMQMDGAITKEEAIGIFNYLVVDFENLKTENGKMDFYLPIGKRRTS